MGCDGITVYECDNMTDISIHAPIVGCDEGFDLLIIDEAQISIHAPIVGCD